MEIIDIPLEDRADLDDLKAFLLACRESSIEDDHFKIASITLSVRHIDPLAVLDSIYEGDAHHFYMENRSRQWAVAGAEAVVVASWNTAERFRQARDFATGLDAHIVAIGDLSLPYSGPLFFGGFTFFDQVDPDEPFPAGMLFIPQWQVARSGERYTAVANARIDARTDVDAVAERIWGAHGKFTAHAYERPQNAPVYHILEEREVGEQDVFAGNVGLALEEISGGKYAKVVLSRAVDLVFDNPCQPLRILNRMRLDYPDCNAFSLQRETGTSFIGATPERLISVSNGRILTEAIAGSAARVDDPAEDRRLASQLMSSGKDRREHQHVVDSIRRRLLGLGIESRSEQEPGILVLPNVQHLHTPIEGNLPPATHILDLVEALHPTPAVGGTPREMAIRDILKWEPFRRGMFAGVTGWFDTRGNGEFAVGIRSALACGNSARLYAGAGIVEGSVAESEHRETSMKMQALLKCIRGQAG